MILFHATFPTPLGLFSAAVNESGALVATAFGETPALLSRLPATLRTSARLQPDPRRLAHLRADIDAYFADAAHTFSTPTAAAGSPFQHRVWAALRRIPRGETRSYGDLARALKTSARAIGRANATNPLCLIVPCHRVIGADGSLTGFAFGEDLKRRLLAHEGWPHQHSTSARAPRAPSLSPNRQGRA